MAAENETKAQDVQSNGAEVQSNGVEQHEAQDGQEVEQEQEQAVENVFQLTIRLPHAPGQCQIMVSHLEQVQDIRQSIIDLPFTFQYTCFHLEHKGKRIDDFIELSEVPDIQQDPEAHLVEDPYTETQARMHFVRIRELIGASGDRTDLLHGIDAGLSLHDHIIKPTPADQPEAPASEHAMVDYDLDARGSVKTLLSPSPENAPKTVKSLALSAWNPAPYHLRQKGHLMYLLVTTLEGEQFHITSHVSGFFVNKSTNNKFDPFPRTAPKPHSAHSLLTLLGQISPSFNDAFRSLQEYNGQRDPLAAFQLANAVPASPWLVSPNSASLNSHVADAARTQESYLLAGPENAETLRDWNEEFQSTRELPKENVQDRVFRERLTAKLFAEYNEAAVRGAVLVARGEVAPLNPTEPRDAQIFVYNNVFYSFGADGVGTFAADGGDEAARVATGKDIMGVKATNQLDISGIFTPGTVVVDYLGKRLVGQSIVPGIFKQREPGEHQIDYGGVEGRDVIAENDDFKKPFAELSKALRVKSHPVWDKENKRHDLEASVETKGLLGTDGRKYILDLYRITPLDVAWLEKYRKDNGAEEDNYPHRMAVLRPELVESYWRLKLREYVQAEVQKRREAKKEAVPEGEADSAEKKEPEQERVDVSGFQFSLNPDVFCGQRPQTEEEKEQWSKDEVEVRAACTYLSEDIIPKMISDLQDGDVGFPMDGQSLTNLLHKRGINMRYLGEVARLSDKPEQPRLQALKQLAIQEMIARAFKHTSSKYLRYQSPPFVQACIAHLLNCLLGAELNAKPTAETDASLKSLYPEEDFSYEAATPESTKSDIIAEIKKRYRFDLGDAWVQPGKQVQLLREVCLKQGLQLQAKQYGFTKDDAPAPAPVQTPAPATNGTSGGKKKKNKANAERSPAPVAATSAPSQTFHPDDVLNVVPIIKDAAPRSVLAEEALEAGRISLSQEQKELGQELLLESLSLHEQIYGILHPEVARVYYALSTIYYGLDEKTAAVELARKAAIISERTLGVDHSETVLSYLNLSLFEHASGNTKNALAYIRHALDLWKVVYGTKHPDSITTINNAAVMLQSMKQYHESRLWFESSLAMSEEVSGKNSVSTATLLFQLAQAFALDRDYKSAVNRMREAFNIFKNELGPEDRNTKEAETWLEQLTQSAVSLAKHAKVLQDKKIMLRPKAPMVGRGARPQPSIGQSIEEVSAPRTADGTNDNRSVDELLKYINGDGSKTTPKKKQNNPKRRQGRS
ncbi:putative eukaryotic translation initiation factor 3 subunit CLU1/TIF31 [Aureobasidium pullulans]|uniref:Clustered mitochondria protein homolog n=1 Tax=Aureobasidium pullulans TaxID=5580 RepID=A0A4S9CVS1_AURPU|nr:putative eukaryotic translation initiation factor 3 subunit CLU1/TIF31 [Aureobasidium pullulans]